MKRFIAILGILIFLTGVVSGIELERQKNAATFVVFPIVDADGDPVTGAGGDTPDSEIDQWADGSAPTGFADCTNEITELGTTGWYYLSLTQTEMNQDYVSLQIKTATATTKTQCLLIRTQVGDPLNNATNTLGYEVLTSSGGYVSPNIGSVLGTYAATNFSGQTSFWNVGKAGYTLTQGFPTNFATMLITAGGYVSPNIGDVTGTYAATDFSGQTSFWNQGKTGYTLTQSFPTNFSSMLITAGGYMSLNIGDVTGTYGATNFSGQTSFWNEGKTGYDLSASARISIANVVNDSTYNALIDDYDNTANSFGELFGALPDTSEIVSVDSLITLMNNAFAMLGSVTDCSDSLKQVLWPLDSTSPKDSIVVWCKVSDTDSTRLFSKAYIEGTGGKVDYISIK